MPSPFCHSSRTSVWRAEAGPRVDHRGASKGPADRNRDGGPAHGDRHPPVAIKQGQAVEWIDRVARLVHVGAGLEHHHVQPGLGQDRRSGSPARAGADDCHIAVLPGAAGFQVSNARRGWLRGALSHRAAGLDPDRIPHPLVASPADHREQLRQEEQVAVGRESGALHLGHVLRARLYAHPAEPPWERQELDGAQRQAHHLHRAGRHSREEARERLRYRNDGLGRRQSVLTRGDCLRDRSQSSELGGPEPRRAPSGRGGW